VGMDVSIRSLEYAKERLRLEQLAPAFRDRIELIHGSLVYRDRRLLGFDVATVVEVIEHLDAPRLRAFERVVFEQARPKSVIVTTPNVEYNVRFETLPAGPFRHPDHRFEWTRAEFETWSRGIAERHGYTVQFFGIGDADASLGAPTQMALFEAS
jgi:3' terminal RNA ribose 2'-O-methyltransferase Hen1